MYVVAPRCGDVLAYTIALRLEKSFEGRHKTQLNKSFDNQEICWGRGGQQRKTVASQILEILLCTFILFLKYPVIFKKISQDYLCTCTIPERTFYRHNTRRNEMSDSHPGP